MIAALCLFAGFYHCILFLWHRKDYELIFFAAFCITVALRAFMSNETFIMQLWPGLPFLLGSRLLTSLVPLMVVAMTLYAHRLYRLSGNTVSRIVLVSIGYLLVVWTTGSLFYSAVFNYYLLVIAVVCMVILHASLRAILHGHPEAHLFFAGGLFVTGGAFNDMLYFNQWIDTGYWLASGLAVFTITQSVLLAVKFSRLSAEKQVLHVALQQTTFAFMQAQIKPHFLYNALSAVSNMITKDPIQAKRLLLDFGDYLRGCFYFGDNQGMTTLAAELEIVRAYLAIEQARFRERLRVEYHITEDLRVRIPVLCLQPLVENAVRHGLMQKISGGTVRIAVWQEKGMTRLRVEDDGVGMDVMALAAVLEQNPQGGVGISNIHNRLLIEYGRGLEINSERGVGTTVDLLITLRELDWGKDGYAGVGR